MSVPSLIGAAVVTFFPDAHIANRLELIRRQVDRMVVVDNGSASETQALLRSWAEQSGSTLITNASNLGLATALNQGLGCCARMGCEWSMTFDQDSTPGEGMVRAQLLTIASMSPRRIAAVGAHTFDERVGGDEERWLQPRIGGFRLVGCAAGDLADVSFVITSGTLTRLRAWRELGGFDEGLFIDYIDHDFCLRARAAGWQIVVSSGARLAHNLGAKRQVNVMGREMRPTFHNATRHYYMARNRILMWRRYAWRYPHWWLFDACFGGLNTVRVMLAEDRRLEKMKAMLHGTWDGFCGRVGPMPMR